MLNSIKKRFYFLLASYFRFWAAIRLRSWNPKIIVITGSVGKTTLLHLIESQFGSKARYSHNANSAFGLPFHILGLKRRTFSKAEWLKLFLWTPLGLLKSLPKEKIYVVEADCDRRKEGIFLSKLLQPDITIWLNVSATHAANFSKFVDGKRFKTVQEVIADEFANFARQTKELVITPNNDPLIRKFLGNIRAKVQYVDSKDLVKYKVMKDRTIFLTKSSQYELRMIAPMETIYSIKICRLLSDRWGLKFDNNFKKFSLPHGRGTPFKGIKNTLIIDSTYNASTASMIAMLKTLNKIKHAPKYVILGDMIELRGVEEKEYRKLLAAIKKTHYDKLILAGPRLQKYIYPEIAGDKKVLSFIETAEVKNYLIGNLEGGELLFFKGARFLEGVIEHLLKDPTDKKRLCRREKVWQKRRLKWKL